MVDGSYDVNEDGYIVAIDRDLVLRNVNTVDMGAYEVEGELRCPGEVDGVCQVDTDDLLAVINSWGTCASPCPADLYPAPCGNGVVNTDDLLMVINNWLCVPPGGCEDMSPITFNDVQDCLDFCSEHYSPHSPRWNDCVNSCVELLEE